MKFSFLFVFLSLPLAAAPIDESIHEGDTAAVRSYFTSRRAEINRPLTGETCPGYVPLACADSVEMAGVLISLGADVNLKSAPGTPLESAATAKDKGELARFLLGRGAKPSPLALYNALWYENDEFASELLDRGVSPNFRDPENGYTPVLIASQNGYELDLIEQLVNAGADLRQATNEGFTVLHFYPEEQSTGHQGFVGDLNELVRDGAYHTARVKLFLSKGAAMEARNQYGTTPFLAAAGESEAAALYLLERGANAQAKTQTGYSGLHIAFSSGHLDLARRLLERGLNINERALDGTTPGLSAAAYGHPDVLKFAASKGARFDGTGGEDRRTALHDAVLLPWMEHAQEFLEEDPERWPETVRFLLVDQGLKTSVNAPDAHGATPWHLHFLFVSAKVTKLLLDNGADVNSRNAEGKTALQHYLELLREVKSNGEEERATEIQQVIAVLRRAGAK